MPRLTRDFRSQLLEDLTDPKEAALYVNAALDDSEEMFLVALRDVAEAYQMSRVAMEAGLSRESIYRILSEAGNPTHNTLKGILRALHLKLSVEPVALETQHRQGAVPLVEAPRVVEMSEPLDVIDSGRTILKQATFNRICGINRNAYFNKHYRKGVSGLGNNRYSTMTSVFSEVPSGAASRALDLLSLASKEMIGSHPVVEVGRIYK